MGIVKILIALLIFGVLILIHEFGHYLTARLFRVGILEFSVGMGPKLISRTSKKTGIAYSLRLLPIGGFVSMVGEDEDSEREDAFHKKPIWQRLIVLLAGATMNLLLGFLLTMILITQSNLASTTVAEFREEAVSVSSGLRAGDRITAVGHRRVHVGYDLYYAILHDGTKPLTVTLVRDGETVVLSDVVFPTMEQDGILFGSMDFYVAREGKTLPNVIKHTFYQSVTSVKMIWESLFDLVTGKYGLNQLSGPVGITTEIGNAAMEAKSDGGLSLLSLTALITINLGVVNLLPLPALDGGRIVFLLIEAVRRKPMKRETEGAVNLVGMVLLLALMAVITFSDVFKLFR